MTTATYILKNALRNKRRATLSILSVAVSLFLFVTLQVALREMTVPPEDIGSSLRVIVRNKVSLAQPLPARQLATIERIPGVAAVTPFTFFGGNYKGDEKFTSFAQFAVDPNRMMDVVVDAKAPADQVAAWIADRTSCLVGRDTATRYGLKLGDRMKFTGTLYPCDLDLKVVGFYSGTADDRTVFFHHKYLDELLGDPGTVGTWWVRAASVETAPEVVDRINRAFANTSAEVRAETERAFQLSMVSMWANIKILIGSICTVVVFTLLLVTVSTMSMAIRERFRELAVLKALGFRRELFGFILAESFGLAMAGALLGAGGAWWLFNHGVNIQKLTNGIFLTFEVTPRHLGLAFGIAALLGVVSALVPSLAVARTSVVQGLKTLD
jgi:putative ABC transport system permease protein